MVSTSYDSDMRRLLMQRRMAEQMQQGAQGQKEIQSPWQGAAQLGQALSGALMSYRVEDQIKKAEEARRLREAQALRAQIDALRNPSPSPAPIQSTVPPA